MLRSISSARLRSLRIEVMAIEKVCEANRIYIRKITEEDTDLIVDWRNSKEVRDHFFFREKFTRQMHEKWMADKVASGMVDQFIVCMKEDDRPVGSSYLRDIDRQQGTAEYGIFIGEADARGIGLGYEILCATMEYAYEVLGLKKVIARAISTNAASIRIFEKYGFTITQRIENVTCTDGEIEEMVMMCHERE